MAVLKSQLQLSLLDRTSGPLRMIGGQLAKFQAQTRAMMAPFTGMTARIAALGGGYLGVTAGMRGTAGAAMGFEDAMADVRKVLDVSDQQFANVRRQVLGLSKVLPNTAEGIAAIYASAAQSNIPTNELGKFSEMVAKVAIAWDVTEGETSQALAEIKTQLKMGVGEIGLYADAVNHLSNNTAARAPDLVDFSKRVSAQGELYGFAAQESLAFGSAMIAMGAESNVAATSFRNMGLGLADAGNSSKKTQTSFRKLGLDYRKMSKLFNNDATGTMLDVFDRIQGLAEHERLETAVSIFGREARALMPVINNTKELRRQLGLVGKETDYAGSAFAEYEERARTTSNTLAIVRNNFRAIGIEMGAKMLPGIQEASGALLEVLKTLGDRVSIFDRIGTSVKAFMQGLGYDGSIKEMVNDLGDLLFGKVDPSGGADELGLLFRKMEGWGKTVREFNDAIRDNPVAKFIGEMAGHGFKLMLATIGFSMLAGAIRKLGKAMLFLSGASAAIAILKTLAGVGGAIFGTAAGVAGGSRKGGKGVPAAPAAGGNAISNMLRQLAARIPQLAIAAGTVYGTGRVAAELSADNAADDRRAASPRGAERDSMRALDIQRDEINDLHEERRAAKAPQPAPGFWNAPAGQMLKEFWNGVRELDAGLANSTGWKANVPGDGASLAPDPLPTLESIRQAIHQPSGTQRVEVVNQQPPSIHLGGITVYATTNASPQAIADAASARIVASLQSQFSNAAYT